MVIWSEFRTGQYRDDAYGILIYPGREILNLYDIRNFRQFVKIVNFPSSKIENISFLET